MRALLRTLLACALLIGGLGQDWVQVPVSAKAHSPCCCGCCDGMAGGAPDSCPCPRPETPQGPAQNGCGSRSTPLSAPLALLQRAAQGELQRTEPRLAALAAVDRAFTVPGTASTGSLPRGRDPDLGRHLARLSLLRI
ncbi:MAG: hypothetical protein KGI56_05945 [Acidobacteriota bacterium]|nr:hypothetical protein [Acidobacteriota bacterium]